MIPSFFQQQKNHPWNGPLQCFYLKMTLYLTTSLSSSRSFSVKPICLVSSLMTPINSVLASRQLLTICYDFFLKFDSKRFVFINIKHFKIQLLLQPNIYWSWKRHTKSNFLLSLVSFVLFLCLSSFVHYFENISKLLLFMFISALFNLLSYSLIPLFVRLTYTECMWGSKSALLCLYFNLNLYTSCSFDIIYMYSFSDRRILLFICHILRLLRK